MNVDKVIKLYRLVGAAKFEYPSGGKYVNAPLLVTNLQARQHCQCFQGCTNGTDIKYFSQIIHRNPDNTGTTSTEISKRVD